MKKTTKKSSNSQKGVKSVKSVKEYKETFFPQKYKLETFSTNNPKRLGIAIADKIFDENKHILFSNK